jgi:oligopeptide transport system permease protein
VTGAVRLVARRIVASVPVVLLVCTAAFFALRAVPGGPYDREKELPPAVLANLAARADLDQPVLVQYGRYLGRVARGDLDVSMKYPNQTVAGIIGRTFPVSAVLGLVAALLALVGGIAMGVAAAARPRSAIDKAVQLVSAVGFAAPTFVTGSALVLLVALRWRLLPPGLWGTPAHVVLPALTLALGPAAYIASLVRAGVLAQLREPYVQAARARGASPGRALVVHALRNALTPVVTVMGPLVAWLVTGSFVVEHIFAVPGLGRHFVTAVIDRDYPLVLGATLFYAVIVVAANLVVDLVLLAVDPRIREAG